MEKYYSMRQWVNVRRIIFYAILLCLQMACKDKTFEEEKAPRPNIIWLVAEDQSPDYFPMYGDSTISLPSLEKLAADGVVYDNAVAPVPVCAPARSALITGMYPTTMGTHNMRNYKAWADKNEPSINVPNYSANVPDGVKMFTEYLRKDGYYCINGPKEDYNFAKTEASWDESSKEGKHHWRKRKKDQPFFAVFNYIVCHESQIWERGKDSLYVDPNAVPVPPYFPNTKVVRHDLAVNYSNLKRMDDQIAGVIQQLKEDGLYENSIIFFYGDHGGPFPRQKRSLYDSGVKVPLIIKFPKNVDAGTRDDRLFSFIDFAPTVLSWAGIEPPKVMQGIAQFGKFEQQDKPEYTFHTSDRFDEIYDRVRAVRSKRFKFVKNFNTEVSHSISVAYREQMPLMQELRAKYKANELNDEQAFWLLPTKPEEELYDLQADPYELVNLAQRPELRDTLIKMRKILKNWMKNTNDYGRYPERDLIEKWMPNGKQPSLPPLEMEEDGAFVRLASKKSDATIIWRQPNDSVWRIYDEPLPSGIEFEAKAELIGYLDSEVLRNY